MSKENTSIPATVFENIYRQENDPWHYTSSPYEQTKYRVSLAALQRQRYARALEIGCSIGVMTAMLSSRCDTLLAVDHSSVALEYAKERCAQLKQVTFACQSIPREFPSEIFDLIVLSEVGFYWSRADLEVAHAKILSHLGEQGHLLLVHWTVECDGHPLTADEVHGKFFQKAEVSLEHLLHMRGEMGKDGYRLDLFERK